MKINKKHLVILAAVLAMAVTLLSIWQMFLVSRPQIDVTAPQASQILTTEKEPQELAQHFLTSYFTYVSGNFANIETLYEQMTPAMMEREKARVARLRQEIADKPREYVTSLVVIKNSERIEGNDRLWISKLTVAHQLSDGAYLPSSEEGYEDFVDKSGRITDPNSYVANVQTYMAVYRLTLLKIDGTWRVDSMNKISQ